LVHRLQRVLINIAALINDRRRRIWILATVISWRKDRSQYEVSEVSSEDENNLHPMKKQYFLHLNNIIRLPSLEEIPLKKRREFSPDDHVLANYPGTTDLYPALVVRGPSVNQSNFYSLHFNYNEDLRNNENVRNNDDERNNEDGVKNVNARYVAPLPAEYCDSSPENPRHTADTSSEEETDTKKQLSNKMELQQKPISCFFPKANKRGRPRKRSATQLKNKKKQTNEQKHKQEKKKKLQ